MTPLTVTKERVLEAAKSCPAVETTLKTLFPEAFRQRIESFRPGDVFVHKDYCPMVVLQAHYNQDKYIFLGTTYKLCYSNSEYEKTMTEAEVLIYLNKREYTYAGNMAEDMREKLRELAAAAGKCTV